MSLLSTTALLGSFAASALAHGTVQGIVAGGKYYQGYSPSFQYQDPPPTVIGWSIPEDQDNGFVAPDAYANPDIICHKGATPGQTSAKVAAGDTIELQWTEWPESHHGPVLDYLAKCPGKCEDADKESLKFFKFNEGGLNDGSTPPGDWASDDLIANNNTWSVKLPTDIAPGNYVLRHEIIALHSAGEQNGAQNYPQCINLQISGGGSANPAGVAGTALYKATDPGILVNIYQALTSYKIPGPPMYGGGSGPQPSSPASSAAPSGSSAAAGSSSAPAASSYGGGAGSSAAGVSSAAPSSAAASYSYGGGAGSSAAPVSSAPASSAAASYSYGGGAGSSAAGVSSAAGSSAYPSGSSAAGVSSAAGSSYAASYSYGGASGSSAAPVSSASASGSYSYGGASSSGAAGSGSSSWSYGASSSLAAPASSSGACVPETVTVTVTAYPSSEVVPGSSAGPASSGAASYPIPSGSSAGPISSSSYAYGTGSYSVYPTGSFSYSVYPTGSFSIVPVSSSAGAASSAAASSSWAAGASSSYGAEASSSSLAAPASSSGPAGYPYPPSKRDEGINARDLFDLAKSKLHSKRHARAHRH